jgi:hypothetical protein
MERRDFLIESTFVTAGGGIGLLGCSKKVEPIFIPDSERI